VRPPPFPIRWGRASSPPSAMIRVVPRVGAPCVNVLRPRVGFGRWRSRTCRRRPSHRSTACWFHGTDFAADDWNSGGRAWWPLRRAVRRPLATAVPPFARRTAPPSVLLGSRQEDVSAQPGSSIRRWPPPRFRREYLAVHSPELTKRSTQTRSRSSVRCPHAHLVRFRRCASTSLKTTAARSTGPVAVWSPVRNASSHPCPTRLDNATGIPIFEVGSTTGFILVQLYPPPRFCP